MNEDLKRLGFVEYDDGFVFSKKFPPIKKSKIKETWEMLVTVSKGEFVNKATFDVINKDGVRVKSDDLYSDGKLSGRGDFINETLQDISEVLKEWSIPFFIAGDTVVIADRLETKVVCTELNDFNVVGVSPNKKLGLVKTGKIRDVHTDNPSVMFKNKGMNYTWVSVFDLRKVVE